MDGADILFWYATTVIDLKVHLVTQFNPVGGTMPSHDLLVRSFLICLDRSLIPPSTS